jgi:hypothetical protein
VTDFVNPGGEGRLERRFTVNQVLGHRLVVTAHQPNFLPGKSVLDKIAQSDAVIWLDEVQYTKGGYTNRNRLPNGSWLTVPVDRDTDGLAINRVRISEHGAWRLRTTRSLEQLDGNRNVIAELTEEINRPYRLLVGLNLALLDIGFRHLKIEAKRVFQSHLDGGHAVEAVSEDVEALLPISERLAMMVDEMGGDVYLSGPSGRRYLDERPFHELGIKVEYFQFAGTNPSMLELL